MAAPGPGRTLEVSSTCGTGGPTDYEDISEPPVVYQCKAGVAGSEHPKEYAVDFTSENINFGNITDVLENPNAQTYFQTDNAVSVSGGLPSEQWMVLNLTDSFRIQVIRIIFAAPHMNSTDADMRPKALCLERKPVADEDTPWEPWIYYAESCRDSFPLPIPHQTSPGQFPDKLAVCVESYFGGDVATGGGYGEGLQEVGCFFFIDGRREKNLTGVFPTHF